MGFCVYFRRTWVPGYNTEIIDPNLTYDYHRKVDFVKKVAWWVFVATLIICVIVLLAKLTSSSSDEQPCEETPSPSPLPVVAESPDLKGSQNDGTQALVGDKASLDSGGFRCKKSGKFVPKSGFCDGVQDCGYDDFTDEQLCTCKHYMELSAPGTVCDPTGESHCPDRSDQLGCPCQPDSFVCNGTSNPRECIHENLVCDSVQDCSNGLDEAFCTAVSSSLTKLIMDRTNDTLKGYVLVRVKGSWHPYCSDMWSLEMGEKICRFLDYGVLVSMDDLATHKAKPTYGNYESNEHENSQENHLWFLKSSPGFDTGPIEDVIIKINQSEGYNCNVTYIMCTRIY